MSFFKKLIQKHLETIKAEREGMLRMLEVCEEGSFRYAVLNKDKAFLNFKIAVLETLV
jgi:hypothetical protein